MVLVCNCEWRCWGRLPWHLYAHPSHLSTGRNTSLLFCQRQSWIVWLNALRESYSSLGIIHYLHADWLNSSMKYSSLAGSIGPVQARYWHITACSWGYFYITISNEYLAIYEGTQFYCWIWFIYPYGLKLSVQYTCRYVQVPGLYWSDAASIGPVQAQYCQLTTV